MYPIKTNFFNKPGLRIKPPAKAGLGPGGPASLTPSVHSRLLHLAKLARFCFSLTPSSAGAERVFSMLKNSFTINQLRSSLEDYTACSVMLQHNKKTNEKTFVINEEE